MITQRQAFRGDPVQLSADQLNAFNRSSNAVQRGKNSLIPGNEKPGTFEILVYAGGEYNPGDVLVIDSPAFPANESLDSGFFTSKSFNVKLSEGAEGEIPVVVAEYIPVDSADFGHGASLTGYVWVKLESYAAGMKYAKPVSGKTTVEPSDSGPFRILSADQTTMWAVALLNSGGGGGGTETIINIDLYTQQWIIDVDAGTCTCTGGYIVVNNTVLIILAGSIVNFSADNNNQVLVCQINPDFSVPWVWGASGASAVIAAKPSIVCFLLSLGTNIQLKINARFYEYVTYIATNPVIGV